MLQHKAYGSRTPGRAVRLARGSPQVSQQIADAAGVVPTLVRLLSHGSLYAQQQCAQHSERASSRATATS